MTSSETLGKTSSTVCDEAVELSFWSDISIQSRDTYDYLLEIPSRVNELELPYCKSEAADSLLRITIRYIEVGTGSLGISVNRTNPQIHHPMPSHPILSPSLPISQRRRQKTRPPPIPPITLPDLLQTPNTFRMIKILLSTRRPNR